MKCPVCKAAMASLVCACGYDESRNYEKYPTFGRLAGGVVSVSCLRNRRSNDRTKEEKIMECPVCKAAMASMVCACGYDESRNYEKYLTFGVLSAEVETVAGMRDRRDDLVRCTGCGGYAFTLNRKSGSLACSCCGRALTEMELKPLTDALGMKKAELKQESKKEKSVVQAEEKPDAAKREEFGNLLNVLKTHISNQDDFETGDPKRIVSIAAGDEHTVALYADGTVAAIGSDFYGQCRTSDWRDITAIAAGWNNTLGLKKDGTVVAAGYSQGTQTWKDIIDISTGTFHTVGVKQDGTVATAGCSGKVKNDIAGWRNIQAVAAGDGHTLGLDNNGNVVVAGKGPGTKLPLNGWKNVKAIAAGHSHSAALTREGMVLIVGEGGNPAELGGSNVELGAGWHYTVVRKADGTAAASGSNLNRRCAVERWTDLVQIAVGLDHVVGLKKDGTLVVTGKNKKGQCDVQKLMRK